MPSDASDMRVKVTVPWRDFPLFRQTPGGTGRWGATQFLREDDGQPFDWWVVTEGMVRRETLRSPAGRRVLVTWEPPCRPAYRQRFLGQFDVVITCHADLAHPKVVIVQPGFPWFVERTYDQLAVMAPPAKTKLLSIVTSNKVAVEGHRRRLALALAVKEHFGDDADLFGRGIRDFDDKWDVLAPYRYTLAVENEIAPSYITEKLTDCFLTETFPLYGGAPNASTWFPAESFQAIDPSDIPGSIRAIEQILADGDHFERALPAVRRARTNYLEEQQFFPLIDGILRTLERDLPRGPIRDVHLRPEERPPSLLTRAARRVPGAISSLRRG